MKASHTLILAWPKEPVNAPPRAKVVEGEAQAPFRDAVDSGRFRRVALVAGHEFQSTEIPS